MIEHAGTCSIYNSNGDELLFARGDRGYVYDKDGREYYDFILGFGPVVIGHNDSDFNSYVISSLNYGIHLPSYTTHHEDFLARLSPNVNKSFSFFKTSSEAISAAIRVSTQANGKKGIIRCGYIGWHDAQIANACSWHEYLYSELRGDVRFTQGFRGVSGEESIYNWPDLRIDTLQRMIENNPSIGIFIFDAFQLHFMDIDILKEAIRLCQNNRIIVVLDETKTSGRVSRLGVSEAYNLNYNLLVLGKALANGAPLSLLVGDDSLMQFARAARITGTFSKEILSIWCALATMNIMDRTAGYTSLARIGSKICAAINEEINNADISNYVECVTVFNGSMFDLKFSKHVVNNKAIRGKLSKFLVDESIILLQGHPSFVCLAHDTINFEMFKTHLSRAFSRWSSYLNSEL